MTKVDLEYIEQGMFVAFVPVSKKGEEAWAQIAKQTEGTGKVFSVHKDSTLSQLRAAGYSVRKAKPVKLSESEIDNLLKELDAL